jgi:hypothetical protein
MTALHPDPAKKGARVRRAHYEAYREGLLKIIPATSEGILFNDLPREIGPFVPFEVLRVTKCGWWVTCVKLDLEARGLIERVPGARPQRVRRKN